MTIKTLWIYGDSFGDCSTSANEPNEQERLWPGILRDLLEQHTGQNWKIENTCMAGSAQDHSYAHLRYTAHRWQPQDMVLFLLTMQSRFWLSDEYPEYSNAYTIDLDQFIDKDTLEAAYHYFKTLSRPTLDWLWTTQRLDSTDYWTSRCKVRTLIVPCFPQIAAGPTVIGSIPGSDDIPKELESVDRNRWDWLTIERCQGNLLHVQQSEFKFIDDRHPYNVQLNWQGWDLRYNHLCKSNHTVLARKLCRWYTDREPVDLTEGFKTKIIDQKRLDDVNNYESDLLEELNPKAVHHYLASADTRTHHVSSVPAWMLRAKQIFEKGEN